MLSRERTRLYRPSKGDYPYDEGKHLIMVLDLHAYADESGIGPNDPYCMVGGFVASPRQWKLFRKAWRAVLDREHVPAFHAVEFFQPKSWKSSASPYHDWDAQRASRFLSALLSTLETRPQLRDVGGLVETRDFFAESEEDRRIATGAIKQFKFDAREADSPDDVEVESRLLTTGTPNRAYPAGFLMLLIETLTHVPDGAKVHFTLDLQNVEEGLARTNYARAIKNKMKGWEKLGALNYESSAAHEPLQAADLYVYIVTDWVTRDGKIRPERYQAAQVLIGKRRRNLPFRDASTFEKDRTVLRTLLTDAIIREMEESR